MRKRDYHGYGAQGYKPGPLHGTETNLDRGRLADEIRARPGIGVPGIDTPRERRALKTRRKHHRKSGIALRTAQRNSN